MAVVLSALVAAVAACGSSGAVGSPTATDGSTTTIAPTTTAPATTTSATVPASTTTLEPLTPSMDLFVSTVREQVSNFYEQWPPSTRDAEMVRQATSICRDATAGVEAWRDKGPLDGAHALAWIHFPGDGYKQAAELAVQLVCPQNLPVLEAALLIAPLPTD